MQMSTATAAAVVAAVAATNSPFGQHLFAMRRGVVLFLYPDHALPGNTNINAQIVRRSLVAKVWYYINNYVHSNVA